MISISSLLNLRIKYSRKNGISKENSSCCMCDWESKTQRIINVMREERACKMDEFCKSLYCPHGLLILIKLESFARGSLPQGNPLEICWSETGPQSSQDLIFESQFFIFLNKTFTSIHASWTFANQNLMVNVKKYFNVYQALSRGSQL